MKSKFFVVLVLAAVLAFSGSALAEELVKTDVVVVGGGAAGLAAAIEAAAAGADVVLLEKLPIVGGSTLLSGGIVYATGSPLQKEQGVEDSPAALVEYWLNRAEGNADTEWLELVAERSGDTIAWLLEMGVEFTRVAPTGTSPVARGHFAAKGGYGIIKPLETQAKAKGVRIMVQTPAKGLITDANGTVVGVRAEDKKGNAIRVEAKAVILATGGYDRNKALKEQYAPVATDHIPYVGSGNTGDGLVMAKEVGAEILAKNGVIGFRGVAADIPYTTPLGGMVFVPGLYVDQNGKRFMNESADYPIIYSEMVKNGSDAFYLILDAEGASEALEKGIEKGVAFKSETMAGLAKKIGVDVTALTSTVDTYNSDAMLGKDSAFGKPAQLMTSVDTAPYYALQVKPATLGTYGGPLTNLDTQVLNQEGQPIAGLFAAGEVANGPFFNYEYPASGTSIQMCLTFGRIAGQRAAALATPASGNTYKDGVYSGTGEGIHGDIVVEVVVTGGVISQVNVVSQHETPGVSDPALEALPVAIVKNNSAEVDTVTGATVTSTGIIQAVKNALSTAK